MQSRQINTGSWVLVFDRGDEFIESLQHFASEHKIGAAQFTGIGGFEKATISWWSWDTKEYEKHDTDEQVEVLSLLGNVTKFDQIVRVHAHTILGRRDLSTLGGHLFSGIVRPTLELHLTAAPQPMARKVDPASGLPLICL